MGTGKRSQQLLHFMAFKIFVIFVLLCLNSCKPNKTLMEWYFFNHLGEDISLTLFSNDNAPKDFVGNYEVKSGDSIFLYSISIEEGNSSIFTSRIDSAFISVSQHNEPIIKWRKSGAYYFREGFEIVQDFYNWDYSLPTSNHLYIVSRNHIRYRFFLSNAVSTSKVKD